MAESKEFSDEYEFLAESERLNEISRVTYFRACLALGLTKQEASDSLFENYQRAGISHLF